MSKRIKTAALVGTIDSLLKKVAEDVKAGEAMSEAGGYQGATTHPTKDVDDRLQTASEGARSAENTADNKAEPNRGDVSVDATAEGAGGGQDSVQLNIGLQNKATGEDPSNETNSTKGGKDDPGSSHPARTDNDSIDGMKYASDFDALRALSKQVEKLGMALCSEMSKSQPEKTAENHKTEPAAPETKVAEDKQAEEAAQAGFDLAGIFAGLGDEVSLQDKQAADAVVVSTIEDILSLAVHRAEKAAEYYTAHFNAIRKQAEGEEEEPKSEEDPVTAMAGGAPEAEAGGGEGPSEEELLALLSGGEGMGAEPAADAMGGGMAGGMGGGMPPEMAGGMPPEAGGMGGGGDEAAMLEQILTELGISPEELAAKSASAHKNAVMQEKYAKMKKTVLEIVGRK